MTRYSHFSTKMIVDFNLKEKLVYAKDPYNEEAPTRAYTFDKLI
jgi:hypothetical protein